MNPTIKAGIVLGVLCSLWTYVLGFTGWYKDPVLMNVFYIVFFIEIAVLIWGLKQTAETKGYGGQVVSGLIISAVGGVIIFVNSIIFTSVVFPNYFEEIRIVYVEMLRTEGKSEEEIKMVIDALAGSQTPVMGAIYGFVGTVMTGLIASLLIAIGYKKKDAPAAVQA
jgi:hypothetical protein